jgi:hypothetical protein
MPFVILPTNSASGGYNVANSLRFNAGSSDYLNRTPASNGNQRTWTYSCWFKLSEYNNSASNTLFFIANGGSIEGGIRIVGTSGGTSAYKIGFYFYDGAYIINGFETTQLFRDTSAWYHLVLAVDTTQATSTDRVKLYINGSQVTSFDTTGYPTQNADTRVNSTVAHYIGVQATMRYFGGYMSEIYMIDGQALTPSSFGETDSDTGIWKPKAYTGTYGTNGFYLQFKNSASLGTDSSGNGNTFTVNNLTSIDQTTDTPTNNFATINSLMYDSANNATLTDGNLTTLSVTGSWSTNPSTLAVGSGKWYYEVKCISGTSGDRTAKIGWGNPDKGISMESQGSILYRNTTGNKFIDNSSTSYGATWTDGDIIGVALDISGGTVTFYKNGTTQGNITISGGLDDGTFYIALIQVANTDKLSVNFGNPPYTANGYTDGAGYGNFSYAVPSGYYSLNTKNLATFG